jgi:hemin uptake protein HemP
MAKSEDDSSVVPEAVGTGCKAAQASESANERPRQWQSQDLFGNEREILITHGDDVYRLRKTRNGKLILHK